MASNFGTKMDVGEGAIGSKLDVVVSKGSEGGNEKCRVVVELSVMGNGA